MNDLDFLYKTAEAFHDFSSMVKISYIRKLKNGKYRVFSRVGKNLGTYDSRKEAQKRLKQVEYFKHLKKKASENKIDLSDIENFAYSAVMRQINKQLDKEACFTFASIYKKKFDKNLLHKEGKSEDELLSETLKTFDKKYQIILDSRNIKQASAITQSSEVVAKYLANIIKFTLSKISQEKRPGSLTRVRNKISKLDYMQISKKKMPASSAMGQSITFVKHTLFGQTPEYVRDVLNYLVRIL